MQKKILSTIFLVVCLFEFQPGARGDDQTAEVDGMIISRTGDSMIVKARGVKTTVILTDDTKTQDNKGILGVRKEYMANTVLIPGLKVQVDGVSDAEGRVVAKTITVDGDDLETAEMIQAGLHPTADQVAANTRATENNRQNIAANRSDIGTNRQNIASNKQQIEQNANDIQENTERFSRLSDYDVKGEATIKFDVGSSKLSPDDQQQLNSLAQNAIGLTGYLIEVKGFADSTGDAAMNEQLSEDRAEAVVGYLIQQRHVPVRRIVAPGAMGEYQPTASNESESGRAQNRRVEVKVLVNKGIIGN